MNSASELHDNSIDVHGGTAQVVPAVLLDTALPQLGAVRDESVMTGALERALFGTNADFRIENCTIAYIRYKPGKNCLVHYRVLIRDSRTGEAHLQRLAAKALPPGHSRDAFQNAQKRNHVTLPWCDPVHHLPDLDLVVWLFPNDARLEGLPALMDKHRLGSSVLPQLSAQAAGPDWQVAGWHSEVVSYVPERRCTLRAEVRLQHRITGEWRAETFYGKAYPDHTGLTTFRNMMNLRDASGGCSMPISVARPLLYEEDSRILWQSAVAGTQLSAMEAGSPGLLRLLKDAARSIGALHCSVLEFEEMNFQERPLVFLARAGDALSRRGLPCAGLVERLIADAGSLRTPPQATVHRDLHLDNILATEEGIALIDLDSLAKGDPVQDLSSLLAHLCSWSLRKGLDGAQVEPAVRAVVRSYLDAVPWNLGEKEFRWHLAAALIYQQAGRCIAKPAGWRLAILEDLVRLAERIYQGGTQ